MASIFKRDTSTIGTVVGMTVVAVAILGSTFLGWEWNQSGQFIPPIIGALAAVAALGVLYQRYQS